MIKHFKCRETGNVFQRKGSRRLPPEIQQRAYMRLVQLDAAVALDGLRLPRSNRLEALSGDRAGQHSLCVNEQWRICFIWSAGGIIEVEIVDYHEER